MDDLLAKNPKYPKDDVLSDIIDFSTRVFDLERGWRSCVDVALWIRDEMAEVMSAYSEENLREEMGDVLMLIVRQELIYRMTNEPGYNVNRLVDDLMHVPDFRAYYDRLSADDMRSALSKFQDRYHDALERDRIKDSTMYSKIEQIAVLFRTEKHFRERRPMQVLEYQRFVDMAYGEVPLPSVSVDPDIPQDQLSQSALYFLDTILDEIPELDPIQKKDVYMFAFWITSYIEEVITEVAWQIRSGRSRIQALLITLLRRWYDNAEVLRAFAEAAQIRTDVLESLRSEWDGADIEYLPEFSRLMDVLSRCPDRPRHNEMMDFIAMNIVFPLRTYPPIAPMFQIIHRLMERYDDVKNPGSFYSVLAELSVGGIRSIQSDPAMIRYMESHEEALYELIARVEKERRIAA